MFLSILILLVCVFLGLFVLMQAPKGGGLASGFSGAQQIGGVQRTTDFLEKGTWTLAGVLMVLALVSGSRSEAQAKENGPADAIEETINTTQDAEVDPNAVSAPASADSAK